jgi:mannose-6-phosphate isomerase-like protein (cupin superfamily)
MSLEPNEDIGLETHAENDQFLRFEGGRGAVFIDDNRSEVADGDVVVAPAERVITSLTYRIRRR